MIEPAAISLKIKIFSAGTDVLACQQEHDFGSGDEIGVQGKKATDGSLQGFFLRPVPSVQSCDKRTESYVGPPAHTSRSVRGSLRRHTNLNILRGANGSSLTGQCAWGPVTDQRSIRAAQRQRPVIFSTRGTPARVRKKISPFCFADRPITLPL